MSEASWYYIVAGRQHGPVTTEALRRLATEGALAREDLVCRPGMESWVAASTLRELSFPAGNGNRAMLPRMPTFAAELGAHERRAALRHALDEVLEDGQRTEPALAPHARLVRRLLDRYRAAATEPRLEVVDRAAAVLGHVAYPITVVFLFLTFVVVGIKADSNRPLLHALVTILPAAVVLHVLALRFLPLCRDTLAKRPARLRSATPAESLALVALALALPTLVFGLHGAVQLSNPWAIAGVLAALGALLYAAAAFLAPRALNVEVDGDLAPGEETLGVATLFLKLLLRAAPLLYGLGSAVAVVVSAQLVAAAFRDDWRILLSALPWDDSALGDASFRCLAAAAIPAVAYVVYAVADVLLEAIRGHLLHTRHLAATEAARAAEASR